MLEDILLVHRKSNRNFSTVLSQVAVWKTCLRQILFSSETDFHSVQDHLEKGDQVLRGEMALSLLLEILCGLHSPIVGETEVFGQFKNFVQSQKTENNPLFADHQKWLNFIMAEVKRTRSEHLVNIGSQSYGSLLRRYTKDLNSITLCGSGQLAQEILPWLAHKQFTQIICRDPSKLQAFKEKYDNLTLNTYSEAYVHGHALIIAAPIPDSRVLELMSRQDTRPTAVFDLRGEENKLEDLLRVHFPHVSLMSLQKFFAEIEETKKETQTKIQAIKLALLEKAIAYTDRTELRPLGWDDLCA